MGVLGLALLLPVSSVPIGKFFKISGFNLYCLPIEVVCGSTLKILRRGFPNYFTVMLLFKIKDNPLRKASVGIRVFKFTKRKEREMCVCAIDVVRLPLNNFCLPVWF